MQNNFQLFGQNLSGFVMKPLGGINMGSFSPVSFVADFSLQVDMFFIVFKTLRLCTRHSHVRQLSVTSHGAGLPHNDVLPYGEQASGGLLVIFPHLLCLTFNGFNSFNKIKLKAIYLLLVSSLSGFQTCTCHAHSSLLRLSSQAILKFSISSKLFTREQGEPCNPQGKGYFYS